MFPSKSQRRGSRSKAATSKTSHSSSPSKPAEPAVSFLFIVNDLRTNDDPDDPRSVPSRWINQRWHPPLVTEGFYAQTPGYVYRWRDGAVSLANGYRWSAMRVNHPSPANGTVNGSEGYAQPVYYKAATVFYCNHFDQFFTMPGDVGAQDLASGEYEWMPLSFYHRNNTSYVEHIGDQEYLAVRHASWIEQLLPKAYRCHHHNGPVNGGLAGNLAILVALVAFSCAFQNLYHMLMEQRVWRRREWRPHSIPDIREERRGMVVTIFTDPENPEGSTPASLENFETGEAIFQ